jgi:signal peptidase I
MGNLLLVILTVAGLRIFCAGSYRISTGAMKDTLQKGDFVLVNKMRGATNPGRERVVLFRHPSGAGDAPLLLSRCVAMPGDTLRIVSGGWYVNGRWRPDDTLPGRLFRIRKDIGAPLLEALTQLQIPCRNVSEDAQSLTLRLTAAEAQRIRAHLPHIVQLNPVADDADGYTFIIPFKGYAYHPDSISLKLYREAIRCETDGKASVRDGKLWMDGREMSLFRFGRDYYWMLSDQAAEAVDSRQLGLIPAGAVVGNVWFCWFGNDPKRIFKRIH